jgi:hypothetical protein
MAKPKKKKQYVLNFMFCCTGKWTSLLRERLPCYMSSSHTGEGRIIDIILLNLIAKMELIVKAKHWPLYPWERQTLPIIQEAGGNSEPIWIFAEHLDPKGFQTLFRTASSELLYRVNYPGRHLLLYFIYKSHRFWRVLMDEKHRINNLVFARLW